MKVEDYYQFLDMPPDCPTAELQQRYRFLMVNVHPDRLMGFDVWAKSLNAAWDTLGDPRRRAEYNYDRGMPVPKELDKYLQALRQRAPRRPASSPGATTPSGPTQTTTPSAQIRFGKFGFLRVLVDVLLVVMCLILWMQRDNHAVSSVSDAPRLDRVAAQPSTPTPKEVVRVAVAVPANASANPRESTDRPDVGPTTKPAGSAVARAARSPRSVRTRPRPAAKSPTIQRRPVNTSKRIVQAPSPARTPTVARARSVAASGQALAAHREQFTQHRPRSTHAPRATLYIPRYPVRSGRARASNPRRPVNPSSRPRGPAQPPPVRWKYVQYAPGCFYWEYLGPHGAGPDR